MKHLLVHDEAELELWQAVDYYETKASGLGLDLEHEVRRAFIDIQETPKQWPIRKNDTRCHLLHRFPYAIYYIEMEDIIWVVAVAHMSRKPYYWLNRLNK
jgi:toxin ParE1/3/4